MITVLCSILEHLRLTR